MGNGRTAMGTVLGQVRLEGGPTDLTGLVNLDELEMVLTSPEKIKIRYLGGYEHYEYAENRPRGTTADGSSPLLRWSGRTKIAE